MDHKSRHALLGKTAVQYVAQRYMLRYPQIEYEEAKALTRLVSGDTFLRNSLSKSSHEIGTLCHQVGIKPLEKQFDERIAPKIAKFLGLEGAEGLTVGSSHASSNFENSKTLGHSRPETNFANMENKENSHKPLDSSTAASLTQQVDLFDAFSDEALLQGSSFRDATQGSMISQEESREFDLLDADSWYKKQ